MTNKFDGITLSDNQIDKVKTYLLDKELIRLRKVVTRFKIRDEGLALFRLQATRMINCITVRTILNKKLKKEQSLFKNTWYLDQNTMIRDYFDHLELLLNKKLAILK